MKETGKREQELMDEITALQQRVADLETFEQDFRASEQKLKELEAIIESIGDGISIQDTDFRIVYQNRASKELVGEHIGELCYRAYELRNENCEICPVAKTFQDGRVHREVRSVLTGRDLSHFEITASPLKDSEGKIIAGIEVARDITERKRHEEETEKLQSQLLQAQKMESIGRFAGGVAHDFNNILSAILGYSELALIDLPEGHSLAEPLRIIKRSCERAAALTEQLLAFSRKQVLDIKVIRLNDIVEYISKMLVRVIGEDILLDLDIQEPVKNVRADASQIEQVLMNLAVNARDAMPTGGRLTIRLKDVWLSEEDTKDDDNLHPGEYVMLSVTDTGGGIHSDDQEKIFEPFFTTKEKGKGTGLGLAMVYGIVKQHNGDILLESEPGKGATFKVYLPAAEEPIARNGKEDSNELPGGDETIMVVDDEPSIRRLIVDTLEPLGYHLIGASNGAEAIQAAQNYAGEIHLLLTDVIMPGMNGRELAEMFRSHYPTIKIIYISGYTDDAISHRGILEPGIELIPKPLSPGKLARKLREILDT